MDVPKEDDILLLADEKFDFDLSLSSSSANEDDEVFFGPVGHKERCVAASLELNHHIPEEPLLPASESHFTWSPLTGEKFVEVYKEAHLLALQIESKSKDKAAQDGTAEDLWSQGVERFIQESKLKISLFEKENEMKKSPKSLKRETYYLSDSPLRGPPLLGTQTPAGVALPSAPARTQGPPHSPRSSLPVEPRTAHPPDQAGTQRKVISKLVRPRAVSVRGKNIHVATEQPMKRIPASPSNMKVFSEKESHRDVPPDKSSAARELASLPAGGSRLVQGKRSLPVPNKLGLKKTLLKPAGYAGGLSRKSSSSGSVSAVISSTCASPAASRARSSEPTSISAGSSPPLSNSSPSGRTGPATPWQTLQAGPAGTSCWESRWATVAKVMAEPAKAPTPAALDGAPTPERGGPGLSSGSAWSQSCQLSTAWNARCNSSLLCRTRAVPTPTSQFKVPKFATGEPPDSATPKSCRAQRPQSCTSAGRVIVHSTPARRSSVAAPQSLVSSTRTPIITKHVSALPTPASRRLSGLPLVTPKTMPRALASPLCLSARRLSLEPRKKSSVRAAPTRGGNSKAASRREDSSPDGPFSPPSAVPQALHFSPEKSDLTFSRGISTEVELDAAPPPGDTSASEAILVDIKLDQLAITPKAESTALIDVPLIDFCNSPEAHLAVGSESRPLIDLLINTPDMKRSTASKPAQEVGQLIDLASPLIQLSPEADKENMDSPLLKF
ncbi:G2 and S phase-expressed protein 1 isoform X1 [Ursus maritimus]|uniref:G2 and S phase-expressed protein 1 isoform X1 n=1 Tax=Ursus maritimus TaxID=29073 RepID=A0A384D206_URSMA|nr:G2 and S phase-expressed protein 1 isoform X1 [Ursus maritimus]XP_040493650.1 G2 and S phase-expressed protein 1 isoform X1 [Ursus maritimus]